MATRPTGTTGKTRRKKRPVSEEPVEVVETETDEGDEGAADSEGEGEGDDGEPVEVLDVGALDDEPDAREVDAELAKLSREVDSDERHRLVKRDPLTAYIQETRRYPLLIREEEQELAVRQV